FPLTYTFINVSDSTPFRFDLRFGTYYPKVDSSQVIITGLGDAAIGYQLIKIIDKEGYPGTQITMVLSVDKLWPHQWSNQKPLYATPKWFYIEKCIVQDSNHATMRFVWPNDTSLINVHTFDPDTTDGEYLLWGPDGTHEVCN